MHDAVLRVEDRLLGKASPMASHTLRELMTTGCGQTEINLIFMLAVYMHLN